MSIFQRTYHLRHTNICTHAQRSTVFLNAIVFKMDVGFIACYILLLSFGITFSLNQRPDDISLNVEPRGEERFHMKWLRIADQIRNDPALHAEWNERVEEYNYMQTHPRDWEPPKPTFECDISKSAEIPTTVHKLRPSDIKVVAAMGDSITAGNGLGATWELEVVMENRGESWCVGGDHSLEDDVITIPNVLRKFNPDLKGYAICYGGRDNLKNAWMNVAEMGGDNRDMDDEAWDIVHRMRADERIDVANDWKLLTLFVGGNDLCGSCERLDRYNSTAYANGIKLGLDILHENLPRTLVNVIGMFDVTPVKNFSTGILCDLLQLGFCDCAILDEHIPGMQPRQQAYYRELKKLVDSGVYDTKNDFTVVLQPMFVNMTPPIDPDTGKYDQGFLSYDCFHPSRKAHQSFAYALWNTMFIPVGSKPLEMDMYEQNPKWACPTEQHPYIFTSGNSGPPV